jgi:hypothetical protein
MQAVQPQPLLLFDDEAAGGDAVSSMPGMGPEPVPLNHYLQNMMSPRSRSEYDEFNRFHFSRLKQQGRDKRAITPKVSRQGISAAAVEKQDLNCMGAAAYSLRLLISPADKLLGAAACIVYGREQHCCSSAHQPALMCPCLLAAAARSVRTR